MGAFADTEHHAAFHGEAGIPDEIDDGRTYFGGRVDAVAHGFIKEREHPFEAHRRRE